MVVLLTTMVTVAQVYNFIKTVIKKAFFRAFIFYLNFLKTKIE